MSQIKFFELLSKLRTHLAMVTEKLEELFNRSESINHTLTLDWSRFFVLLGLPRTKLIMLLSALSFASSNVKFLLISLAALSYPNS